MIQPDLLPEENTLIAEERKIMQQIGLLAKIIGNIGVGYAVFITLMSLYRVISVTENTKMWSYYKTIPGFISILVIILSGILYWFISMQILTFGQLLRHSIQFNRQEYFTKAWRYFSRALLVIIVSVAIMII